MARSLAAIILFSILSVNTAQAQQCVSLDVPYIHQVLDMERRVFYGCNACGPTCSVMLANYYGLLPDNLSDYKGWYIYNGYDGFKDFSGQDYTARWAYDCDGNESAGAHNYIIVDAGGGYWGTDPTKIASYLSNHSFDVPDSWTYTNLMAEIEQELNEGRPLVGHMKIGLECDDPGAICHYFVIVGTDAPNRIIVNDPYGDYNEPGWGSHYNGQNVIYNISDIGLDMVLPVTPHVRGRYPENPIFKVLSIEEFAITPLYQYQTFQRQDFRNKFKLYYPVTGGVAEYLYENEVCAGETERGWDPAVSPFIVQAYNDHGRAVSLGNVYSDAGYPEQAHTWWNYWIQNFDGGDLGECCIMYKPGALEAFSLHGRFWNKYRYNGGPDMDVGDGVKLGCPTSREFFINGVSIPTQQDFEGGYMIWDGVDVNVFNLACFEIALGGYEDLIISAEAVSPFQAKISVQLDPYGAPFYRLIRNGFAFTPTSDSIIYDNGVKPETEVSYQIAAVDHDGTFLGSSNEAKIIIPEEEPRITVFAEDVGRTYIDIRWEDLSWAPFYETYLNGQAQGPINGADTWSFGPLEPDTSYGIQVVALTATFEEVARSNLLVVKTLSEDPPEPPPPPEPDPEVEFTIISGIGLLEDPPYVTSSVYTAFFEVQYYGSSPKAVDRFQVQAECVDQWGSIYTKNFASHTFVPARVFNPGDTYRYEETNDGWPLPGLPTTNTLEAYVKFSGIAGQYQIVEAAEGATYAFIFETVDPSTLKAQLSTKAVVVSPSPLTNDDNPSLTATISNEDGDADANDFDVVIEADDGQSCTIVVPQLLAGEASALPPCEFDPLSVGSHNFQIAIDPDERVPVYDRAPCYSTVIIEVVLGTTDSDNDGVLDDGDGSTVTGDYPCTGGMVEGCDDNCINTYNPYQEDCNFNGVGDACDTVTPTALEICDGIDNDCNAVTADGIDEPWYNQPTSCGVGQCAAEGDFECQAGVQVDTCTEGVPSIEVCDTLDNDCDGLNDEADDLGYTTCGLGVCEHTIDNCIDGVPQVCDPFEGAGPELCDKLDNDCDGFTTDDGVDEEWYAQQTSCGVGECASTGDLGCQGGEQVDTCDEGQPVPEACVDGLDNDCDGFADRDDPDCPGLTEIYLESPSDQVDLSSPPVFVWSPDGGIENVFAVDFSFSPGFTTYYSTYEHLHLLIRQENWSMPITIWNRIPNNSYVFWRVRGADMNEAPLKLVTSLETRWFHKVPQH